MSYRVKWLAWGLVFLLYAGGAWGEPSASDRATARVLADEAGDALDKKNYEVASDRFARADALVHAPTLLLGLARAQAGLHKFVEAQENYQRILREGVPAGAPPAFAKALQDAQRELKSVTSKLAWVTVTIKEPATSVVMIDGTELPRAALDVRRAVNPGSHVLQATAEGYNTGTVNIDVAEGEAKAVALTLEPKSGSVAHASTTLAIGSETTPTSPISPVGADAAQPASSRQRTFGFIGLGVGAAGLAVGGVAGLIAMSRHSALETDCQSGKCPASAQSTLDGFRTMATVSTVGFVLGGVAAATGGALLLTAPRAQTGRVEPYIGLAYVGARVRF